MATTVGDTLATSKLAVAQDDLHLAGSSVDQLTVQFNQLAFDEFLASDRNGPNKRRCSEDHQPTTRGLYRLPPRGLHLLQITDLSVPQRGPLRINPRSETRSMGGHLTAAVSSRRGQIGDPNR